MRCLFLELVLCLAAASAAEVIDRIAVTVAKRVITQSDILLEIRLSAFLNQTAPDFGPASRKLTAERLADRALFDSEMEIGRYTAPQMKEVEPELAALKKERYLSEEAYRQALTKYRINEEDLRLYLLQQLAVLRFIDARFGPGVQILEPDVSDYYTGRFVKQWEKTGKGPVPALEEVHGTIEESLRAEQVNRLMDQWLKEARSRTRIEFKPEAFQ
ncbi:MAG TPA: hypothetical protein VLH09_04460 [Bryobacteraceae bacterium]|nr:hypothetical protein [Bryobacteraceae bacterium]